MERGEGRIRSFSRALTLLIATVGWAPLGFATMPDVDMGKDKQRIQTIERLYPDLGRTTLNRGGYTFEYTPPCFEGKKIQFSRENQLLYAPLDQGRLIYLNLPNRLPDSFIVYEGESKEVIQNIAAGRTRANIDFKDPESFNLKRFLQPQQAPSITHPTTAKKC